MKNYITICLALLCMECYSQITLDFQSPEFYLYPIKLSNTETKYYNWDQWRLNNSRSFSLYNSDGSLYKTIQMPQKPDTNAFSFDIQYISRTLFDNDSSNIEYLIDYQWDSIYSSSYILHEVKVIREDGTILLDEMHGQSYASGTVVYPTEEGTKLMLSFYFYANGTPCPYQTRVFNLPGILPSISEDKLMPLTSTPLVYPNPNNGSFYIKFQSKEAGINTVSLYSITGKLIQTFNSSDKLTHMTNLTLPSGLYLLNTTSNKYNTSTKMIIEK